VTANDEPDAPSPRRRIPPFVLIGAAGVIVIAVLVVREVASIRAGERELDRKIAELDAAPYEDDGTYRWEVDWDEAVVRLTEVQRQGPGTEGRYHLDVGSARWALDLPPTDADASAWATWEASSRPRWAALATSLRELAAGGADVRAELFAPWQDEPDAVPERLLLQLLPILAAAGVVDVDLEHAPPALLDDR